MYRPTSNCGYSSPLKYLINRLNKCIKQNTKTKPPIH